MGRATITAPRMPRCGLKNETGSTMCARCYSPLNEKQAVKVQETKTREEEIVTMLVKKLMEMNPDLFEEALREIGAPSDIARLDRVKVGQHQGGADGGYR